jgi:hypothetical protein
MENNLFFTSVKKITNGKKITFNTAHNAIKNSTINLLAKSGIHYSIEDNKIIVDFLKNSKNHGAVANLIYMAKSIPSLKNYASQVIFQGVSRACHGDMVESETRLFFSMFITLAKDFYEISPQKMHDEIRQEIQNKKNELLQIETKHKGIENNLPHLQYTLKMKKLDIYLKKSDAEEIQKAVNNHQSFNITGGQNAVCGAFDCHEAAVAVRDSEEEQSNLSSKIREIKNDIAALEFTLNKINANNAPTQQTQTVQQPSAAAPSSNLKTVTLEESTLEALTKHFINKKDVPKINEMIFSKLRALNNSNKQIILDAFVTTKEKEIAFKLKISICAESFLTLEIYCDKDTAFKKINDYKSTRFIYIKDENGKVNFDILGIKKFFLPENCHQVHSAESSKKLGASIDITQLPFISGNIGQKNQKILNKSTPSDGLKKFPMSELTLTYFQKELTLQNS